MRKNFKFNCKTVLSFPGFPKKTKKTKKKLNK